MEMLRFLLPIFAPILVMGCSSEPEEFTKAASAWGSMTKSGNLKRSVFPVAYPNQKPSEFVKYAFSDFGLAEWPSSEAWADPAEAEAMVVTGQGLLPSDIAFVSNKPDPKKGKQIVVTADDTAGKIMLTGYVDPKAEPVMVKEFPIKPVVQSASEKEFAEMLMRNNSGLGMEY